ncbi:MAG TPA: serine hydrolase domain-containing protein [Ignavibacteria bacterium]|nr:serine hydrolase domain-containing protein [Ignavibacteria bacterium]HMR42082.1 serine hydrolase domain-containing protein [Ignavibacteria bacterium]
MSLIYVNSSSAYTGLSSGDKAYRILNATVLPAEIDSAVKEYAVKMNCRILVQVVDPDGIAYNIGYDGRNNMQIRDFDSEYIDIGSCTKMFTAASVLQLVEEGKLRLTDRLTDIFPDEDILRGMLVINGIDYIDSVTVQNLLSHTSGIPDYFSPDNNSKEISIHGDSSLRFIPWDLVALAKGFNNAELIPGSSFNYSNTNYILLGLIIEKYSNMKYADYVVKNILQPLGMENTFLPSAFSLPGRKDGHYNQKLNVMPATLAWSAGEIISTPADMNKFIRGWYSGKLFSDKMCNEVRSNYFNKAFGQFEYGLGILKEQAFCFGHGGQTFGFQSFIGCTTSGYSFAIGIDDAAAIVYPLESVVVYSLKSLN